MKIHVHLWHALDVERYRQQFLIGRSSDLTPYGYHHAGKYAGTPVQFSLSHCESRPVALVRKLLKLILGFDIVHFWRNRHAIRSADVVWTHTEAESLALALMLRATRASSTARAPVLLLQSVWLVDRWTKLSFIHRWLYRRYLGRADALTFHSPANMDRCAIVGPPRWVMWFGISTDMFPLCTPALRPVTGHPFKILAVGNDIHRDWKALAQAFGNRAEIEVRVASSTFSDLVSTVPENFECGPTRSIEELLCLYRTADLVVLPLHDNLHASGLTVMLEAVTQGVPVLATRTGGLDAYFRHGSEVHFCDIGTDSTPTLAENLWTAAAGLLKNPEDRQTMAINAQTRFAEQDFTSAGYARRQFELSKLLLESRRN